MASIQEALADIANPQIRHIVNVSGGKDSSALAIYLKTKYPQIPAEYVFCDTGCELRETYAYLERIEALLGSKVIRLNALDNLGVAKKGDRTPFDVYLNEIYGGFLPNPRSRWCTRALKIEPFEAYVGQSLAYSYIGIRADEDRDGYKSKKPPVISARPNILPVYPFKDDEIGLPEVLSILHESGLGIPDYYGWRSRSGCYFCFYQQIGEWQGLKEKHPDLFDKAAKYEKAVGSSRFTWCEGRTLSEVAKLPRRSVSPPEDGCAICHI